MTGAVLLRRTSISGPDTLIAVIAIFEFVIKETFFNTSVIAVLIVTAIGEIAVIVSIDTGLVTSNPLSEAFTVAFSVLAAVYPTVRVIIILTAETAVSALYFPDGAGSVALFKLP